MNQPFENKGQDVSSQGKSRRHLQGDCEKCFGLCCVALRFSASEGFPVDKDAGQPCLNLQPDFRCSVHQSLSKRGLKGCITFDCFGAGQKVSQDTFAGQDWQKNPDTSNQMYQSLLKMMQLHELLWYLTEALTLRAAQSIHGEIQSMIEATERLTNLSADELVKLDVTMHRATVNTVLVQTSELVRTEARRAQKARTGGARNGGGGRKKQIGRGADLIGADLRKEDLRGANLRGAYLIAANLRGTDLRGADFIGADFRDADLRGADLSKSIFLTQSQLNAAKGDASTRIPAALTRPEHWGNM
ncbi:pentapeptide repeat-containing protein [Brevibacillus dissolubilis]|uniref:pentapeptide repeat-containing protein n=1 Tax=Brevibacillus dissolubilis TaxID=1844116 RepID=UPI001115BD9F|nr:pentapeptide repeat-containing protein [Brevibacillus dissolubilis]